MQKQEINVKELRAVAGMTQQEFSHEIGVTLRTVAGWEAGRKPSRMAMEKLLKFANRRKP